MRDSKKPQIQAPEVGWLYRTGSDVVVAFVTAGLVALSL
jgi:hypothetical protein